MKLSSMKSNFTSGCTSGCQQIWEWEGKGFVRSILSPHVTRIHPVALASGVNSYLNKANTIKVDCDWKSRKCSSGGEPIVFLHIIHK